MPSQNKSLEVVNCLKHIELGCHSIKTLHIHTLQLKDSQRPPEDISPRVFQIQEKWSRSVAHFLHGIHNGAFTCFDSPHLQNGNINAAVIMGGRVEDAKERKALETSPIPILIPDNPCSFALNVDELLLPTLPTLVIDLGRVFLRMRIKNRVNCFARNYSSLPSPSYLLPYRVRRKGRRTLATFFRSKVSAVVKEAGDQPTSVLLGLPSLVSCEQVPLEETYIGLKNWRELKQVLFGCHGLIPQQVRIVSSTELAGLASATLPQLRACTAWLVITLGVHAGLCLVTRNDM